MVAEDKALLKTLEEMLDSDATPEQKSDAAGQFLVALAARDFVGLLCVLDAALTAIHWCAEQQGLHEIVARVNEIDRLMEAHERAARPTVQ
jgi:hypothetical protein